MELPGDGGAAPTSSSVAWVTLAAPPLCPLALGKSVQGWRGRAHTVRVARAQRAPPQANQRRHSSKEDKPTPGGSGHGPAAGARLLPWRDGPLERPSPSGLVAEGLEDPAHGQGGRERSTFPAPTRAAAARGGAPGTGWAPAPMPRGRSVLGPGRAPSKARGFQGDAGAHATRRQSQTLTTSLYVCWSRDLWT